MRPLQLGLSLFAIMARCHGHGHGRRAFARVPPPNVRSHEYPYKFEGRDYVGYVAYPAPSETPRPGALIGHQWTGVQEMERYRADELASHGFVTFVPDLYGKGKRPAAGDAAKALMLATAADVPRFQRQLQHALATLKRLGEGPPVNASALVANGYCFGGQMVLELARANAAGLRAVTAFHGNLASLTTAQPPMQPAVQVHHAALDAQGDAGLQAFEQELVAAQASGWTTHKYGGVQHGWTDPANAVYAPAQAEQAHRAMLAHYEQLGLVTPPASLGASAAGNWGGAMLLGVVVGTLGTAVVHAAREQQRKKAIREMALASTLSTPSEENFPSSLGSLVASGTNGSPSRL